MSTDKEKKGIKVNKDQFYKGLIKTRNTISYIKKEEELYNPEEEVDDDYINDDDEKNEDYWDDIVNEEEESFSSYDSTKIEFTNLRINKKFEQLVSRYIKILDRETTFGFCIDIITEFIDKLDRDYLYVAKEIKDNKGKVIAYEKNEYNGKLAYHDDISTINVMLDTRINNLIDEWRGTKEKTIDGVTTYYSPKFAESLNTKLNCNRQIELTDTDSPQTINDLVTDRDNLFYDEPQISDDELDIRLNRIYKKAKLTDREIEIVKALDRTPDNENGGIYTKKLAGELLDCTGQNISNIFNKVKEKVMKVYRKENRYDKIRLLNEFLNDIEDETDIINFILENLDEKNIEYLFYISDLDADLVKYFNLHSTDETMHHTDLMREFSTYFIKEVYEYKKLIKHNIKMQNTISEPLETTEKWKYKDIDTTTYIYKAWDKLQEFERKGEYITIDKVKYYKVAKQAEVEEKVKKTKRETITFLKR